MSLQESRPAEGPRRRPKAEQDDVEWTMEFLGLEDPVQLFMKALPGRRRGARKEAEAQVAKYRERKERGRFWVPSEVATYINRSRHAAKLVREMRSSH